mgnify:CR=1 FL=1
MASLRLNASGPAVENSPDVVDLGDVGVERSPGVLAARLAGTYDAAARERLAS